MTYAIVGSRDFANLGLVRDWILDNVTWKDTVISGGARGVDEYAVEVAKNFGIPTHVYPANWAGLGKAAGFIRNQTIVDNADTIVAFWDGKSRGTKHTIGLAKKAGKRVVVIKGRG